MKIEQTIDCIDCGGVCHLLTRSVDGEFEPGEVVIYRCADCLDRWDIVVPDEE